ncbi:UDP-glucose 4-epimerase GalE [Lactobacillaceae bacterium Melli_B3]
MKSHKILVAGGAGYIGSYMVDKLIDNDFDVVVVDNLSTGHRSSVNENAKFYEGDTRDIDFLDSVFQKENIDAVVHMDAYSVVPESIKKPLKYFDNNLIGMIKLLEAMKKANVNKMIFSSTAAVYGNPVNIPIKENDVTIPINPYGASKLMMEQIMESVDRADGIHYVSLRYFNAAGAKSDGSIVEDHNPETHLIPNIMRAATGQQERLEIFGDDYPTKDGTNIRDYIQIEDLIDAHILALKYLDENETSNIFNLGSSNGFSVKEILNAARNVTNKDIPAVVTNRRVGDPDVLIADSKKAEDVLNWNKKYDDINKIIQTAWSGKVNNLNGYSD